MNKYHKIIQKKEQNYENIHQISQNIQNNHQNIENNRIAH